MSSKVTAMHEALISQARPYADLIWEADRTGIDSEASWDAVKVLSRYVVRLSDLLGYQGDEPEFLDMLKQRLGMPSRTVASAMEWGQLDQGSIH